LSPSAQAKRLTLNPQTQPYILNPKPKGDFVALGQEVNPKPYIVCVSLSLPLSACVCAR